MKDVELPQGMQRAMARQAEAERERRAKIINAGAWRVARDRDELPAEERVRRSVARTLGSGLALLILLGVLGAWFSLGAFTLRPGEAAVLLRLGRHAGTIAEDGFHLTLPPPLVLREIVNVGEVRNEDFGRAAEGGDEEQATHEASMQTSDNNIVRVCFSVSTRSRTPSRARYRVADPDSVVRDASQAAMREAVGGMTVDGRCCASTGHAHRRRTRALQDILDRLYDAGMSARRGRAARHVQAPAPAVRRLRRRERGKRDADRRVDAAEGYRDEVLPGARAQAARAAGAGRGHREAVVADATGEAARFQAVAAEYRKAPGVTEKRLYLETMEQVLPKVEKVIIEPGTANVRAVSAARARFEAGAVRRAVRQRSWWCCGARWGSSRPATSTSGRS